MAAKHAELVAESEALSKEMKAACPKEGTAIHFIALCIMSGVYKLQVGDAEDQKAAERWLRQLWDSVDVAFIMPSITGTKPVKKDAMSAAAYAALEGYFSCYGNLPKAIDAMMALVQKQAGVSWPKDQVEHFGVRLGHIVKGAMSIGKNQ